MEETEHYPPIIPELIVPNDELWNIVISYVFEENRLAITLQDYSKETEALASQMNDFYNTLPKGLDVPEIVIATLYATKVDGNWRRVYTTNILNDEVECYCVDSGDIKTFPINRLKRLLSDFYYLPFQAIWVYLDNMKDKVLFELVAGKTFMARVILRGEDYYATIVETITGQDDTINTKLFPQMTLKESLTPVFPDVGKVKEVNLHHLTKDGILYFSLCGKALNTLDNLMIKINQLSETLLGKVQDAKIQSTLYSAKFMDDGLFYRAQVLQKVEHYVEVYFVDYGNTSWVDVHDIVDAKDLNEMFEFLPFQALACKLVGFPPQGYFITDETITEFFNMTQRDKTIMMKGISVPTILEIGFAELYMRLPNTKALVSINRTFELQPDEFFKQESN